MIFLTNASHALSIIPLLLQKAKFSIIDLVQKMNTDSLFEILSCAKMKTMMSPQGGKALKRFVHADWTKKVREAERLATKINQPILLSEVIRVNNIEPLSFFANCKANFKGERFFWRDPNRPFIMAGAGKAYTIDNYTDSNRYAHVEKQWLALLQNAQIYGDLIEGTGPLLFGAFSFDPKKKKTELWQRYTDTHFFVPTYLLTQHQNNCYLTISIVIMPSTPYHASLLPDESFLRNALENHAKLEPLSTEAIASDDIGADVWMQRVSEAINRIQKNEFDKVVLSREMRVKLNNTAPITSILQELSEKESNSYIFALEAGHDCFIGATPERLVQKTDVQLFSACVAGSTPRGSTEDEDIALGNSLLQDIKNRKEHQFVVDMICEARLPVCSDLHIPGEPTLMKLKHIQHLYTPVTGRCNEQTSLLTIVERLHPTPALGGWPKKKAVEVIRELEPMERGLFGAPLGWIDAKGNGEFVVAIRSALIKNSEASLFAGCGIVNHSDPVVEYEETKVKMRPLLTVLGGS